MHNAQFCPVMDTIWLNIYPTPFFPGSELSMGSVPSLLLSKHLAMWRELYYCFFILRLVHAHLFLEWKRELKKNKKIKERC